MKSYISKIKKTFFLDNNEFLFRKFFGIFPKKNESREKKTIIFNASENYYDLCYSYLLTKDKKYKKYRILFYIPLFSFHKKSLKRNIIIFFLSFYFNNLILILRNYKWKKLYSVVSNNFTSLNNFNFFEEVRLLKLAEKQIVKLKTKKDIHNLKYNGIKIGDLIYDTFLRYKNTPTINLKDPFLIEIYAKIIFSFEKLKKIKNKTACKLFFTNQLSYIHHGFPSRFFISKNIKVKYFGGKASYLSDHNINNYWHSYNFRKFPQIFKNLKNKKEKIKEGKQLLINKFKGKIIPQETSILKKSAYEKNIRQKINNFKGVIFLHCFVDAPTGRGKCLFNDFYEWTDETLNFLEKQKLSHKIAVKPHPYSKDVSSETELNFKKKYPNFVWLSKKISNKQIFSKKLKFGISALGTVLPEIAYHKIFCMSAGMHPSMAYNFVYRPKTKKEYFNKILEQYKSKKQSKKKLRNKIYEYIYCDFIMDHNKGLLAKKIKLKEWNFTKSSILINFLKEVKKLKIL